MHTYPTLPVLIFQGDIEVDTKIVTYLAEKSIPSLTFKRLKQMTKDASLSRILNAIGQDLYLEGIKSYKELKTYDKCNIVSHIISALPACDSREIFEFDHENILPKLIADTLINKFSTDSIAKMTHAFITIFVNGLDGYPAPYEDIINKAIENAELENMAPNNEHFEHDAMNRAQDVKWGQAC